MSADRCYAWPASSNSFTASQLFSAAAACAPRCPAARRSMPASTAASRRRISDSIAPTARLRSPWMSLADEGRDDTSPSPGVYWFHGVCPVETRWRVRGHNFAPVSRTLSSRIPEVRDEKTPGQGTRARRRRCSRAISSPTKPCDFLWSKVPESRGARRGKTRDPVVLRSLPPPIAPGREVPGGRGHAPAGVIHSVLQRSSRGAAPRRSFGRWRRRRRGRPAHDRVGEAEERRGDPRGRECAATR